jgi:hypothetical protein
LSCLRHSLSRPSFTEFIKPKKGFTENGPDGCKFPQIQHSFRCEMAQANRFIGDGGNIIF